MASRGHVTRPQLASEEVNLGTRLNEKGVSDQVTEEPDQAALLTLRKLVNGMMVCLDEKWWLMC